MVIKSRSKRMFQRKTEVDIAKTNNKEGQTLTSMFNSFMIAKSIEGLAKRTLSDYYTHFQFFQNYLENQDVMADDLNIDIFRGYIAFMLHEKNLSPMTINIRVRTMRAFIRYCYIEGWVKEPIHERFKPIKTKEDTLASFTPEEVKRLINVIDDSTYKGFRDMIIVYVLLDTLVRCAELVNIKRKNVDLKSGSIQLEASGTKGKRARLVPLSDSTIKLLREYFSLTEEYESDFLFLTYEGQPLSDNTVRKNLAEWGEMAGINNKRVSPHTFRHTGALFYVLNGGDPFSLQKILGHTDMSMVRKYIQMTNTDVKRQHNLFSPLKQILK